MTPYLIVGNWKMNRAASEAPSLVTRLLELVPAQLSVEVVLAPPFTSIPVVAQLLAAANHRLSLGAQNVFWEDRGAYTGEVSVPMLADLGCRYVILGHSERRHLLGEQDEAVNKKVKAVLRHGLFPILCVGETLAERQRGQTEAVIRRQLDAGLDGIAGQDIKTLTVAYEPVWAIGTGQAASVEQAAEVHRQIRSVIGVIGGKTARGAESLRILYGGSVTAQNIGDLLSSREIDGALVGGACLDPEVFAKIIQIAAEKG
ncbi:MAG TPA: triose-phosphate isomerase [Nitrospiraceae bacterium]|nr:triose-phosphate isomerase [Nitrospiraceae bacterium]